MAGRLRPDPRTEVVSVRSAAAPLVLDHAWHNLALDQTFATGPEKSLPALERAVFAILAHRILAGRSAASVAEWVRQDVLIPGLQELPPDLQNRAARLLGDLAVRDKLEKLVLARLKPRYLYLARDISASDTAFALAVNDELWPVLTREWPDQADPEKIPLDWARQLSDNLSATVVIIQPRRGVAPEPATLRDGQRHGVRFGRLPVHAAEGTRWIFVRCQDPDRPGHEVDHVIEANGHMPSDYRVACAYLDGLPARQEFAELLARPLPSPLPERDQAARAQTLVAWIALLLARQVEHDTELPWSTVRTELLRMHHVTLRQRTRDVRTPLSPTQRRILNIYEID